MRKSLGFTLIEVLVAVTIVSLLTTMGIVSYQVSGRQSRDAKRKSDLEQIRVALEMYRSDKGQYPTGDYSSMISALLDEECINTTPSDPKSYSYYYNRSASSTYNLCAYLEAGGEDDCGDYCSVPNNSPCNYQLVNP